MGELNREEFFTIGEFAKLFGISKQTLMYYERKHIFKPAQIDSNGYRYYSMQQYFDFDIICNLHKLGVPLKKIAVYMTERNTENLQQIYTDLQSDYRYRIAILERNIQSLQAKIERLRSNSNIHKKCFSLEQKNVEYLVAHPFPQSPSLKKNLQLIARHNYQFNLAEILNEYLMGYIVPQNKFLNGTLQDISHIFTRVVSPEGYRNIRVRSAGVYASVISPFGYHTEYKELIAELAKFIKDNDFIPASDLYIEPLRNYWSTTKENEYITKISVLATHN